MQRRGRKNPYEKNSNWSQNAIRTVNQVTERAICQCPHLTSGFGVEINLIWIQSDSLLPSAQWSEEWCLVAAMDLQSESDSHQTDASLPLPVVTQGHRTGLTHRKKHRRLLIGFKLASSSNWPLTMGERDGTEGERRKERAMGKEESSGWETRRCC